MSCIPASEGAAVGVSPDEFRDVCARWATGVTIVTARSGDRIHGMTVSAFSEVSMEPPLVLICADRTANTRPVIEEGGVFAVNILARDQEELSNRFASKRDEWVGSGVQDPSGESGSFVGHQVELRVRFRPLPGNVLLEAGYAHLFAGRFIDEAPNSNGGDTNYVYTQVLLEF